MRRRTLKSSDSGPFFILKRACKKRANSCREGNNVGAKSLGTFSIKRAEHIVEAPRHSLCLYVLCARNEIFLFERNDKSKKSHRRLSFLYRWQSDFRTKNPLCSFLFCWGDKASWYCKKAVAHNLSPVCWFFMLEATSAAFTPKFRKQLFCR